MEWVPLIFQIILAVLWAVGFGWICIMLFEKRDDSED
jgi:hypothetical protein